MSAATRAIGLGCMRLSTEAARPDGDAILAAAIAAGVTLLDTADVYCHTDADLGHNEQLVARAIVAHPEVRVVTKGGLTRPDGAWVPNGRAKHLDAAARASLARLGRIDLYLLHAIDPKTPLTTSVRALAKLVEDGIVPAIGLSNVNLTQLEAALAIAPISAVEIELHPYKLDALRGGLIDACTERGIEVLAHRPLGGPKGVARLSRDQLVRRHATRLGCTPTELILNWLRRLSPMIVPLPGATRIETAQSAAKVIEIDDDAARALGEQFVAIKGAGPIRAASASAPIRSTSGTGEVVLVIGIPGAGKSTRATDLVERGYLRLNRDDRGGTLIELARILDAELANGATRVVLDNTYPSRASRRPVIEIAKRHGLAIRCVVIDTPIERAQRNAVLRMLARHGRLLEPAELRGTDIGPSAQFRWRREWEPPRADEGFDVIEVIAFQDRASNATDISNEALTYDAALPSNEALTSDAALPFNDALASNEVLTSDTHRPAILVELDDIVWRGRPRTPDKIVLHDGVLDALRAWHVAGFAIGATSWQPGVEPVRFAELVRRLGEMLDVSLRVHACHHAAGPPVCWCRKPLPGLALALAHDHHLTFTSCVGGGAADKGFALRAGIRYHDAREGWPHPSKLER